MPKPYSQNLRERVVGAVEAGVSRHEAAAAFEVSVSSAVRRVAQWRQTGTVVAKPMGGTSGQRKQQEVLETYMHALGMLQ